MDKNDFLIIAAAIVIVLVLAVFVKPALTGQPATIFPDEIMDFFAAKEVSRDVLVDPMVDSFSADVQNANLITYKSSVPQTPIPIPSYAERSDVAVPAIPLLPEKPPTPKPKEISSIEQETIPREIGKFVIDGEGIYIVPRAYPGNEDTRYSFTQIPNTTIIQSYAGKYSTKTSPIEIESRYFTISYTVDLPEFVQDTKPGQGDSGDEDAWAFEKMYSPVTQNNDDKDDEKGVESFSVNNPQFSITIINADTGEVVQTITQTNLDSRVWAGLFGEMDDADDDEKYENVNWDPRPWAENIFAGEGEYLFEIQASALNSYRVDILVPNPDPVEKDTERLLLALFIQRELRTLVSLFERDNLNGAYDYFATMTMAHIADEEVATEISQRITDLKPTRGIVSAFTITDAELYGASPVLSGTLTIDNAVSVGSEERDNVIVPWSITIDAIPTSRSQYQGVLRGEVGDKVYEAGWRYPTEIIQIMLQLEDRYAQAYGNGAPFYQDEALLETYSSDLMLLSAAQDRGSDISSSIVPIYPEPYLIPLDMHKFIAAYNADNIDELAYGEGISDALSKRINDAYTLDEIYQYFLAMRYAGITLKDFTIYSVDVRGNEASIRGEFIWDLGGNERKTPCEIIVVFEWTKPDQYMMWKIDTLPPLRY